jgi:gliding motility-associated-like protein
MGTGDTVIVDIVNLIQDPDYLEELLWYLDNGCEVITYVTNPNNISNIEIETDLNYLSIGGTLLCEYSPGCTDPEALNYNPDAIEDDGSCEYGSLELDLLGEEIWEIGGTCTDPYFNQSFVVENTGEAVIDSFLLDIFITTWDNQFVTSLSQTFYPSLEVGEQYTIDNLPNIFTGDLNYVFVSISWYDENGELVVDTQSFNVIIYCWGCTDPEANNYIDSPYVFDEIQDYWTNDFPNIEPPTPEEIECTYDIYGCTDDEANNYNPDANIDDGSCTYDIFGCTDPGANNFNPLANVDDGSCTYDVFGCTDSSALNYNSFATVDDGSCEYVIYLGGCTDPDALNYNPLATYDDGTCITECEAWAPNTFSPNNDGVNDAWYVNTDSSCWLTWYAAIFDRWGQLVWESTNPNGVWDGSNNGGSYYVADGVYVFLIRAQGYNTGDTFQTTGHITLFR